MSKAFLVINCHTCGEQLRIDMTCPHYDRRDVGNLGSRHASCIDLADFVCADLNDERTVRTLYGVRGNTVVPVSRSKLEKRG